MPNGNSVELGAKSAAARRIDAETVEIWFLTDDNLSVHVRLSHAALNTLMRRVGELNAPLLPD